MAGEMRRGKPNILQKLLHQIVSIRPVNAFFSTRMHRMDFFLLKLTGGKYTFAELAGWPIIQITTTGAKSGQKRTMPLIASMDGKKIILIASSFGREHNPGWYYNLKAHPECEVEYKGKTLVYAAREVDGAEYEKYWQLAVSIYAGYERYKKFASHRHIPVMLLEPKE
ncbi:MAG: nitroreductase family deazaflavin-dependent oxidoreductase [Anaerolineales bacterium]|nr:nitroreductase family deazaflavin-dependent oxidoreductase [Anaerolineales bacterium]